MKRHFMLIIAVFVTLTAIGERRASIQEAQERSIESVKNKVFALLASDKDIISLGYSSPVVYCDSMHVASIKRNNKTYLYIVNLPEEGWAIVSNEQRYPATFIGYSHDSHFDFNIENHPGAVRLLLEHHMNMIDSLRESPNIFLNRSSTYGSYSNTEQLRNVMPLLKRNGMENLWGQSGNNGLEPYNCSKVYNKFCPDFYDVSCGRTDAGCTAVAIAQILWYWRWPDYALINDNINMAGTTYGPERRHYYDWDNMLTRIYNTSPRYQVDMVAGLLRDCGFAANMLYTGSGSAAGIAKLEDALDDLDMHWVYNFDYAWTNVQALLIQELQAARPVICQAGDGSSIHTFVIDGFESNMFHVNFGWCGLDNGMWDVGFNGYNVARAFFTELYPICTSRESSVYGIDETSIESGSNITLYSSNQVYLSQLVVKNGGHLNVSAGSIRLGSGFSAKQGSQIRLAVDYHCSMPNTSPPVSISRQKQMSQVNQPASREIKAILNPITKDIIIQCDDSVRVVSIFDLNGRRLLHSEERTVSISHLPKGIYIIQALTENGLYVQTKILHQ